MFKPTAFSLPVCFSGHLPAWRLQHLEALLERHCVKQPPRGTLHRSGISGSSCWTETKVHLDQYLVSSRASQILLVACKQDMDVFSPSSACDEQADSLSARKIINRIAFIFITPWEALKHTFQMGNRVGLQ